jgi:hypothetical protein
VTVHYKWNPLWGVNFPVLHRVVYGHTTDGVQSHYQRSYKDYLVDQWLKDNCRHGYYHSPGWELEKFIEFECDQEALMFALRWA